MEESLYLNDKYELMIKTNENNEYNAKFIFDKVSNPFMMPSDIKILDFADREIKFEFEKTQITFYKNPTNCFLEDEKINTIIYSIENLKLITKKLNYKEPILFKKESDEKIILNENEINDNLKIDYEDSIIIKDNILLDEQIKNKFKQQTDLLDEYKNNNKENGFPYKVISINLRKYLKSLKNESLEEPFCYFTSKERFRLEEKIEKFIMDKNKFIFPIVGPYGIGKSLTALILQKKLFIQGIKSLYINIKYYSKEIPYLEKLDTLINECYYLCSNVEDYIKYHKLFQNKNNKDIWQLLKIIYDNISDYTNYLFILDQYKASLDPNDDIFNYPKIHIFLLSSINDKDIKSDIKALLKNEKPKLRYNYLIRVLDDKYYLNIYEINKKRLIKKVTDEVEDNNNDNDIVDNISNNAKNNVEDIINNNIKNNNNNTNNDMHIENIADNTDSKLKTINYILSLFGFLPRYISLLLNKYENIYDFSNEEYKNIFRKFKRFFEDNNISKFQNLSAEYINAGISNKYMDIALFINNLNYIPLKYVNYEKYDDNNYHLKYAFPLCREIFDTLYIYDSDKTKFITDTEGGFNTFEKYLIITLRCSGKLQIDGYFEVNTIVDLDLTDYYQNLNNSYFVNKSNILIAQDIRTGKDFDFCIFKPDIKVLILIQVKYCIKNDNVSLFSYYQKKYSKYNEKFEKKFKTKIEKVYLLYFSSYYFNIKRKIEVFKILNRNRIKCLFFNTENSQISFNFINNIESIQLDNSFILFPEKNYNFQFEKVKEENLNKISTFLNKKKFMSNKKRRYAEGKIEKFSIEDTYYEKFIDYFRKDKSKLNSDITKHLDKFIQIYINSFGNSEYIPNDDLYIFVFELSNGNINFNGKLGLVYVDNFDDIKFIDINSNKALKEDDFCKKFENCCYAIGKYNRS